MDQCNAKQVTEAIYTNGVLKPVDRINLREKERVRLTVERLEAAAAADRDTLLAKLRAGIERMNFRSRGPYPSREEIHDRRT
jgi:predicted DNA-binding antitoxin AbrB/MazE fold protein